MENQRSSGGRVLKIVAIAFTVVIITLIFLSKTIYTYNLPQVTGVMPTRGRLNNIEYASGIVTYGGAAELYCDINCKIEAVLIAEGDSVEEGDPIFEVSFENADTEIKKQLSALEDEHKKRMDELALSNQRLSLDIERIDANITNTKRKMEELKAETYKAAEVADTDIIQCERDIAQAREDLDNKMMLFDAGAIPRNEIDILERGLLNLQEKLESLKKARRDNLAKNADAAADMEANRQKQLRDYEYQLDTYAKDLSAREFDKSGYALQSQSYIKDYEKRAADLNEKLQLYDKSGSIYAPAASVLTKLNVNKGARVNAGQLLASFGITSDYIIECEISLDNNFVAAGDRYKMSNSAHSVQGVVTKITPTERAKQITLSIDGAVSAGETFEIVFEKQSAESYTLVPNGAVGQDGDGYYLNQIKRRAGILGDEFYTEKLRIYIGDNDSSNTAVTRGITFPEPVVLISDKPFTEGDTVKIRNEGDFFAE